jgi:hypothetical protein
MRREFKILLIVFGSLFGLLALGIIALVIAVAHYGPALVKDMTADPVAMKRTADKIATFDVPPGYRISSATDLRITQTVMIVPAQGRRNAFNIQLQGTAVPSDRNASVAGMKMGLGLMGRFTGCDLKDDGVDDVAVRGVPVKLAVFECTGRGMKVRVETGTFPGNAAQATIVATGYLDHGFDSNALHALLRSVR